MFYTNIACAFDCYLPLYRYDLLHNAHLNLEGLDELFKVAQVQMESTRTKIFLYSLVFLCCIDKVFCYYSSVFF